MELSNGAQLLALASAAAFGLVAGVGYDVLRRVRARGGALRSFLCDALFCCGVTAGLFLLMLALCPGTAGAWEPAAFLGSFALYLALLSEAVGKGLENIGKRARKILKKA